jgi:hypothetical protein
LAVRSSAAKEKLGDDAVLSWKEKLAELVVNY